MPAIVCFGIPYALGEYHPASPVFMVEKSGFAESIGAQWVTVQADFSTHHNPIVAVNQAVAKAIQHHAPAFPLIFAHDCVTALGVVKGLNLAELSIVWLDAHGDFNTPQTSPSGYIGGMPLAMLVGRGDQTLMTYLGLKPLPENQIILTDARNLDRLEAQALENSQIHHVKHVSGLNYAEPPAMPFYIHLDTDVIDAAEMPAQAYAEPNGASISEVIEALRYLGATGNSRGLLITVWDAGRTSDQNGHLGILLKLARHFSETL